MDIQSRIIELSAKGYECSQIMMLIAMEMEGMENPDLIRAMSGLNGGMGRAGKTCGCMSGGVCVLGLFTGKGEDEEIEAPEARAYMQEYVKWFESHVKERHGGYECDQIIHGNYGMCVAVCMPLLTDCMEKIMEMLQTYQLLR